MAEKNLTVKPLPEQELGQMHMDLLIFLKQRGFEYTDCGTHFTVAVPRLVVVEEPSKIATFDKK
jgi:hypothetical protein